MSEPECIPIIVDDRTPPWLKKIPILGILAGLIFREKKLFHRYSVPESIARTEAQNLREKGLTVEVEKTGPTMF